MSIQPLHTTPRGPPAWLHDHAPSEAFELTSPAVGSLHDDLAGNRVGGTLLPPVAPDGTRLVFSMGLAGATNNDIYTMKLDGTDLVQLTNTPDVNEYFTDWGIDPR